MEKKLIKIYKSFGKIELFDWLNGRSYSEAFVICLGAGPWKFARRKKIQGLALERLAGRDIIDITNENWYPLDWQNKFLNDTALYLQTFNVKMDAFCHELTISRDLNKLYSAVNCKRGTKVISLFIRDSLRIPSFPIDRHVKRFLIANKFPTNEDDMIKLCLKAGLDPIFVATGIIKNIGQVDNPNWKVE